ncbi:MAG: RNA polymerase sigma-70 factor [Maribacter sp.]|nr:RNA polymerase sigma-70 factor [Maribacter sp.]
MAKQLNKICDSEVFERIYNTYAKSLRRFIYFKTNNIEETEDILQDTFVKLWNNCDKVIHDTVKSYLFTIANNLFLNIKKHEAVVRKNQVHIAKESTNESPEFLMIEKQYLEKIEAAIAELPPKQREAFLMSRIEKKKNKEIAETLNISVKAVEKRMHQALKALTEKIGKV